MSIGLKDHVSGLRPRIAERRRGARKGRSASSIVGFYIDGQAGPLADGWRRKGPEPSSVIEIIKHGMPIKELAVLQGSLELPMERLAPKLGISRATLQRRKAQGVLGPDAGAREVEDLLGRIEYGVYS